MKNNKTEIRAFLSGISLLIFILLFLATTVRAQTKLELGIGDPAPPLSYSKWIKGQPIDSLTGEKIYVLEFWATWCKPCIEAMPHLSDLADKYADKMKVIGVNVSERTGSQPYESALPKVEAFVAQNAATMRFDIIADNNQREMNKNWLQKANIVGIPATIVVRDNQILWIGHPVFLDKVLAEIFDNKYDMLARKKVHEESIRASMATRSNYDAKMSPIDSALTAKNYASALKAVDKVISDDPAAFNYKLKKLQILLDHFQIKEISEFLNVTVRENQNQGLALAGHISNQNQMPKEYDLAAIRIMKESLTRNTYYLDRMAFLQSRVGDFEGAATTQQRALTILKENALTPSNGITPETLAAFEDKIEQYKRAAKK